MARLKVKHSICFLLLAGFLGYTAMVYTLGTGHAPAMDEAAARGRMVWQENNCTACHQLYGLGGYLGPDLTNVISAPNKGPEFVRAMILSGPSQMPVFQLDEGEISDLVAFLSYADGTGEFPAHNARMSWYGSYRLRGDQ